MHTIQYMLPGCRLNLVGQGVEDGDNSTITELKQFTLDLDDHVSLGGNRPHLEALAETLLPYARHVVSAQAREHKSANGTVSITPWHRGHRLRLRNEERQHKERRAVGRRGAGQHGALPGRRDP